MELVVVERSYEEPVEFADVDALEKKVAWCADEHRVKYLYSYFSRDRKHMICLYEAPDAEAVRKTQEAGKLPYDHLWTAKRMPPRDWPERREGYVTVAVQRALDFQPTEPMITELLDSGAAGCLKTWRTGLRESLYGVNDHRMLCVFYGTDAESVRKANVQGGLPFTRAWAADVHER